MTVCSTGIGTRASALYRVFTSRGERHADDALQRRKRYSEGVYFLMKRRVLTVATAATAALVFATAAWAIRFTDESFFTPAGTVGVPYSHTFTGAGGCGPALPYQYTLIGGKLPPGLTLAFSGGVSGTPTQAGSWSFWVNLSDQDPPSADWCRPAAAQREFTITINGGSGPAPSPTPAPTPTISITTASLPAASVGTSYSLTFAASGGADKNWTVAAGSLPAGLSLSPAGVLSGTPQTAGTASFTVQVSAGGATAQKQFSLQVVQGLTIAAPDSQDGEVRVPLSIELGATGGTAPYRWQLTQGSLPTHVGFIGDQGNGSSAMIKGVPSDSGTFPLTFTVSDAAGRTTTHTITLRVADKLRIAAVNMPRFGHVGRLYRARAIVEGGFGERTWSVAGGKLPAGLHLDAATGVISGRPSHRGRYTFYLTVKDKLGATRTTKISIVVAR